MVSRGATAFPFAKFGDAEFIIGYNPDASRGCSGRRGTRSRPQRRPRPASARADFEAPAPES